MSAISYYVLSRCLITRTKDAQSILGSAVRKDFKGRISVVIYVAAIALSFVNRWVALGLYAFVALPGSSRTRRIERKLDH